MTKSALGYRLSSGGEAIALRKLEKPISGSERTVFKLDYQTAVDAQTRNAMFCFGDRPNNADLVKVGTAIGKGTHEIFPGGWANAGSGAVGKADFDVDQKFTAHVIVDLAKRIVVLEVGETRLERPLPKGLKEVVYTGIYVKATSSDFSPIEIVE